MCGYSWENCKKITSLHKYGNIPKKTKKKTLRDGKLEVNQLVNMSLKGPFGLYRVK